jgi:putative oxidoreductase
MTPATSKSSSSLEDLGLLALRLTVPTALFLKHGLEKLHGFHTMAPHFPNPVHAGHWPSFLFAMIADGICMPLLIVGLFTRPAALWSLINLLVAWALVHHFAFFGRGSDHGELVFVYIGVMLTLLLAGPGRYSIDRRRG